MHVLLTMRSFSAICGMKIPFSIRSCKSPFAVAVIGMWFLTVFGRLARHESVMCKECQTCRFVVGNIRPLGLEGIV